MAVVRFSAELIQQITDNASDMFKAQQKTALESGITDDMGIQLYDWLIDSDARAKMDALPAGFMRTIDHINISHFSNVSVDATFTLPHPKPWPYTTQGLPNVLRAGYQPNEHLTTRAPSEGDLVGAQLLTMFHFRRENIERVRLRKDKFVSDVSKICSAYTTLAPALKAFPALWDLLPQHAKNRHLEVVERKTATSATALPSDVNLSEVAAVVIATKMLK
jgi:hypothetical protein